ncbi:RNA polymerase sigma-70 factor [Chitinophaga arvensicola]|uniref:RNA polymerase sigma-70 factor, ECF subfamily n=1 Tax=Chitinophaga arvensicola TaxID=29529 RepID=A0A1I0RNT7_9BACT|nr:RNA polymerase sigma-70 factor [Chitinophaga arvensicola]SEW42733.1 RNA polymerase sigma-70 factor, ECF subfamily [Chitinophaga arvensicola]
MPAIDLQELWDEVYMTDDQQSFRKLFNLLYGRLVRFATDLAISPEAAEEIVSDVFVQLWKNRTEGEPILYLKTYLYTAVRNRCYNYHRDHEKHQWLELEAEDGMAANEIHPQLEWKEMQQWLDGAVASLSPQGRTIFRLVREEGFKYKEVAAILQISPRTVETQLVRATSRLREALRQYGKGFDSQLPVR